MKSTTIRPNIVCVFADQLRAQALGFAGDPNVKSPNLDRLARENVTFTNATCCLALCTPARAALLTGRYPLSNGVFMNDMALAPTQTTIGHATKAQGYQTAYIGKWHLDGPQRKAFTPPDRRGGFDHWAAFGSGHQYFNGFYYRDEPTPIPYEEYEPKVQTRQAIEYLESHAQNSGEQQSGQTHQPFCMFLSYGPPHDPYLEVPEEYLKQYDKATLIDRPNFMTPYIRSKPPELAQFAKNFHKNAYGPGGPNIYRGVVPDVCRDEICGYYAHITAMDEYVGQLLECLDRTGLAENTIFVFMSDHGDMLGSHQLYQKQWPYDESMCIPFIVRYPNGLTQARQVTTPLSMVDVMPTLLGLAGLEIPESVQGTDLSHCARGETKPTDPDASLLMCPCPFLSEPNWGMREFRGVRTERYTYARSLQGPWLLFDNQVDPYQQTNLVNLPEHAQLQKTLENKLNQLLKQTNDDFTTAQIHRERAGVFIVKDDGAIPVYSNKGMPDPTLP